MMLIRGAISQAMAQLTAADGMLATEGAATVAAPMAFGFVLFASDQYFQVVVSSGGPSSSK